MPTYYENLKNKTAIITGGASGLGAGIAKILAKQGAVISLLDINSSNLQKTKNEIEELGNKIFTYTCDVTNQNQVKETIELIEKEMNEIHILVNSAGVIGATNVNNNSGINNLEDWDATYSINVKGTAIVSEEVASKMKKNNYGKIINISSHGGKYPNPGNPAYSASKAAVINLTQSYAAKWAKNNINVNVICPGSIWTSMWEKNAINTIENDKSISHLTPREFFLQFISENCPLQREQTAEDIGNGVAFFASDNSLNITGQSLNINGGTIMD
tara:strand:+ start:3113 stop:3931 length:819 start_codon:yes stop_codon:yes gene_type:complete